MSERLTILQGDCRDVLKTFPDESVNCCVTSPPYWGLRDYGCNGQIGLEQSLDDFLQQLVSVFREVRRVLRKDGTCWVNMGDSYNAYNHNRGESHGFYDGSGGRDHPTHSAGLTCPGMKPKELIGQPWRLAFALQADGWWLRQDIIWHKPNPMPESVRDRCTKAHEYLFLLTKSASYWWDAEAIREDGARYAWKEQKFKGGDISKHHKSSSGAEEKDETAGRNRRSVWTVPSEPYSEAHFATYPPSLIRPCILAGCPVGGVVLDPFGGSGTTGQVAIELGRRAILIELNPDYVELIRRRTNVTPGLALA